MQKMEPSMLSTIERRGLNAADGEDGVEWDELFKWHVGDKTIADLLERGLLETFPHPVQGYQRRMYRATSAGGAALKAPKPAKPAGPGLRLPAMRRSKNTGRQPLCSVQISVHVGEPTPSSPVATTGLPPRPVWPH